MNKLIAEFKTEVVSQIDCMEQSNGGSHENDEEQMLNMGLPANMFQEGPWILGFPMVLV